MRRISASVDNLDQTRGTFLIRQVSLPSPSRKKEEARERLRTQPNSCNTTYTDLNSPIARKSHLFCTLKPSATIFFSPEEGARDTSKWVWVILSDSKWVFLGNMHQSNCALSQALLQPKATWASLRAIPWDVEVTRSTLFHYLVKAYA